MNLKHSFEWTLADLCFAFSHDFDKKLDKIWQFWLFRFEILSLFGPETLVAVNPPRKKQKKTVTQPSIKSNDGFSLNFDIQMWDELGEMNPMLQEHQQ